MSEMEGGENWSKVGSLGGGGAGFNTGSNIGR